MSSNLSREAPATMEGPFNPMAPPPNRRVEAGGGGRSPVPANVPFIEDLPAPMRPTVAVPADNTRLSELIGGEDDEEGGPEPEGIGPRIVILHEFVKGFPKGRVVWASELIPGGVELYRKAEGGDKSAQRLVRQELKRLADLGAVREANRMEGQYAQVTFVEGEAALSKTAVEAQMKVGELETEVERLARIMRDAGLDPQTGERINSLPDDAAAQNELVTTPPPGQPNIDPAKRGEATPAAPVAPVAPATPPAGGTGGVPPADF